SVENIGNMGASAGAETVRASDVHWFGVADPRLMAFLKYYVLTAMLFAVYCAVYLFSYIYLISPAYSYMGMKYRELPDRYWVVMFLLAFISFSVVSKRFTRPSDYASWVICMFVIVPGCFIPFFISKQDPFDVLPLPIALVLCFVVFELVRKHFPMPRVSDRWTMPGLQLILPIGVTLLAIYTFYVNNFRFSISYDDVYTRRMMARETVVSGTLDSYLISWLSAVGIPISIILATVKKNILYFCVAMFAIISSFSLDGAKSDLFSPLVIILVVTTFAAVRKHGLVAILIFLILFVGFSIFEHLQWGTTFVSTVFVRREIVMPAQLTTYYWDYFSRNPFVYLGDSILRFIPDNNTIENVARLIGYKYFGHADTNANVNIFGSGFAQFGYAGMLGASIAGGMIFSLLDRLGTHEKLIPACAIGVTIGVIYTNSAFLTTLLSNGVVLLLLILYVFPWKGQKSKF
ncbi:MAG TPA: hypothetical protein VK470_05705, partial [Bacteroidota bacterium]|nr:hypothetical protein [Bacteroidota bacterium]